MIMVVCCVFDSAVNAFGQPFFSKSKGEAMRGFMDACRDDKMPFKAHPGDYSLFYVGSYDDATATFVCPMAPERLALASEMPKD